MNHKQRLARSLRRVVVPVVTAVGMAALVLPQGAGAGAPGAPDRINGELLPGPGVTEVDVTADGSTAVYLAPQDTAGVVELYAVGIDGGTPRKLSAALPAGGVIADFALTPDGSRAIYRAEGTEDGTLDLWSVPVVGGTPVKLSGRLADGASVGDYRITPDGAHVVFLADATTPGAIELYSRAVDGSGSRARINDPLPAGDAVLQGFRFAPDGGRVVYRIFDAAADTFRLHSADVTGAGPQVTVNGPMVSGGNVDGDFFVVDGGDRVVYLADQAADRRFELWSAPMLGGAAVRLNGALSNGEDVLEGAKPSPDGTRMVFRIYDPADGDGTFELWSAPVDGGAAAVRLHPDLAPGRDIDGSFFISPDSTRVVYIADRGANDVFQLYSVGITGQGGVQLSDQGWVADEDSGGRIVITPDSARVVYQSSAGGALELYSVPIAGGPVVKLNGPLVGGGVFPTFEVTPDGGQVIFVAPQNPAPRAGDLLFEIFRVPVTGGVPERINGDMAGGRGDVQGLVVSPAGGHVVYRADATTDDLIELYSVALGLVCDGRLVTIEGTAGDDLIEGTEGDDVIAGFGGDDVINGRGGDDVICSGGGADTVRGGRGDDTVLGGRGADRLVGGGGADVLLGGRGGDDIRGGKGPDIIGGGAGADTIAGGSRADTIEGNGGADTISGGKGADVISGGSRADTIEGDGGGDAIAGNGGRDVIVGGGGVDVCDGGPGADTVISCEP